MPNHLRVVYHSCHPSHGLTTRHRLTSGRSRHDLRHHVTGRHSTSTVLLHVWRARTRSHHHALVVGVLRRETLRHRRKLRHRRLRARNRGR